jgi:hypothetical protein
LPSTVLTRSFITPLTTQCSGIAAAMPGRRSVSAVTDSMEVSRVAAKLKRLLRSEHGMDTAAPTAARGAAGPAPTGTLPQAASSVATAPASKTPAARRGK